MSSKSGRRSSKPKKIVGWREWVSLPDLGVNWIKVKVDTGARSSCLHAFNLETWWEGDQEWVGFEVYPLQRQVEPVIKVRTKLLEYRTVRSSSGHEEHRPVIRTPVQLGARKWKIDLTLSNRDQMGFRMLLGRKALEKRFLVEPSASFLLSSREPDSC